MKKLLNRKKEPKYTHYLVGSRYSFFIFCLVIFSLMVISCTEESDDFSQSGTHYIVSLATGNEWTYRLKPPGQRTEEVTGTMEIDGTEVFIIERDIEGNREVVYLLNKEDGLYQYGSDDEMYDPPKLIIKYPASANDTFTDGWGNTITVLSTSTEITVPAGTFTCVVYQMESYGLEFKYSPGTGLIGYHYYLGAGVGCWLESHSLH